MADDAGQIKAHWHGRDADSLNTLQRPDLAELINKDSKQDFDEPLSQAAALIDGSQNLREKLLTALKKENIMSP